ncbi:MAG: ZIP family metal transporter [Deferribacterota bacterium]|nr:ZIP family metal transporter [Deferribacterota bacterium]
MDTHYIYNISPVMQALFAGLFTWFLTAVGASLVFFFKEIKREVLDGMLGFAAGVMIAASFWSLLAPAIEMSENLDIPTWLPVSVGFLLGGVFLLIADRLIPHLHIGYERSESEGIPTNLRRSVLLVLAITLHNIPEGLAVGVAFGGAASNISGFTLASAIVLAIGIGIQNMPEGAAVSVPLRRENISISKCFFYGQASGIVEPIAAVLGAAAVIYIQPILPYALAFAAGAMIYVVVEELIPESQLDKKTDISTIFAMLGFTIMMVLDVALG